MIPPIRPVNPVLKKVAASRVASQMARPYGAVQPSVQGVNPGVQKVIQQEKTARATQNPKYTTAETFKLTRGMQGPRGIDYKQQRKAIENVTYDQKDQLFRESVARKQGRR